MTFRSWTAFHKDPATGMQGCFQLYSGSTWYCNAGRHDAGSSQAASRHQSWQERQRRI